METKDKRKVKIALIAILVLVLTIGGVYALWTYSKTLGNQTLISGDIFLKYTEGDTINIKEAMPSLTYNPDDYFEFTVEGKNTYKKDIVYEILLDEGDAPTGEENKTRTERIKPELLKFRLVEVTTDEDGNEQEEELIQEGSYDSIDGRRIWVDRVEANTTSEIKYTYRLYMWISKDAKIGNMEGADYTAEVWNNNVFASVKVGVNGDFNPKDLTEDYLIINAKNESGQPYDLKQPVQSDEDITITLGSKREITKFVVSKSSEYPIALMSLEEPTDYPASYNDATRAWEATITLDETGIYDYYAVYDTNKNSKIYSFTILMNPDRFVKVEKPTSALCKQGLTYTGEAQDLIEESNLDQTGYTITQVQGTDANSYEVKAKLKEKFRWADSSQEDATFNCTIGSKETILTYEPASDFKVPKSGKATFKINAPTSGTFEVSSSASGTASVEFTPASGTSTTVTVQGVEIGSTSLDIKFTPSNNNYTTKTDTYSIEVFDPTVGNIIKEQILSHTTGDFNLIIEDEDGTIYFSGTNEQINFNYVWYSGKLWRITAINPDNTIKMITQDEITAINWGANTTYKDSWIYQWLNEDFLDTLENQENIIVQNAKWNVTFDGTKYDSIPPAQKPETLNYQTIVEGKVGLLNAYEYYQSYKNIDTVSDSTAYVSGYLNIGYYWWLITPYNGSNVRYVNDTGSFSVDSPSSVDYGVRPSVNLKSDIKIDGGDGSKENPYRIRGDKIVAKVNDKLNSRVSGEYVNFDKKKYRIVGIENEITKLTSVDYVRDSSGSVMTKRFSITDGYEKYGGEGTTGTNHWAGYLNNTTASEWYGWYGSISAEYKSMLVQGTYYLGQYGDNVSYKNTICSSSNTTDTTKECSKVSSSDVWEGYVGLPRVGEMFSAQLADKQNGSSASYIWLITPFNSSRPRSVAIVGALGVNSPYTEYCVRPSITLNSNVVITEGEGTEQSPYEIKCDSCA